MDLTISGKRCRIHRNDRVAQSLEEGANLIELHDSNDVGHEDNWNSDDHHSGQPSHYDNNMKIGASSSVTMVERHDARTLLDDMALEQFCNQRCAPVDINTGISTNTSQQHLSQQPLFDDEGTEEEIAERNFVRYGGLISEYSSCFLRDKKKSADSKPSSRWGARLNSGSKMSSFNSEDGTSTAVQGDQSNSRGGEEPFQLSEEQMKLLPPAIALPKTARHNTIIEHTASRIASNNQLEVFLKVKQADNEDFSFLNPSDDMHQYFQCLKKRHGSKKPASKKEDSDDSDASCNPLSGLLGGYASSSDESSDGESKRCVEPNVKADDPKKVDKIIATEAVRDEAAEKGVGKSEEQDRKRKADRLERLRIWKESRLKQSDK